VDNDLVSLREHLATLRRRLWLIVVCGVLGAAASYGVSSQRATEYEATADVLITPYDADNVTVTSLTSEEVATEVGVIGSDVILRPVLTSLGSDESLDDFDDTVDVEANGDTSIASITARRPSPAEAVRVANDIADTYLVFRDDRRPDSAALGSGGLVLSSAIPQDEASSPRPLRAGVLGGVLGVVLGVALALAFAGRSREASLRAARLPETAHTPLLMSVPGRRHRATRGISRDFAQVQAYRSAARLLTVRHLDDNDRHQPASIVVTSATRQAGRTTVAANLAAALAHQGRSVLLVDAETRRPRLASLFGAAATKPQSEPDDVAPTAAGANRVATHVAPRVSSSSAPRVTGDQNALTARQIEDLPEVAPRLRLLASRPPHTDDKQGHAGSDLSLTHILRTFSDDVDVVVVDAPALLDDARALDLVQSGDVVLLVESATQRDDGPVLEAVRRIAHLDREVTGLVVTGGNWVAGSAPSDPRRRHLDDVGRKTRGVSVARHNE